MLALTHAWTTANASVNYSGYVPQRPCHFPIAPMGDSRFARCLQGGGVAVVGGSVSIVNSQIYSNTVNSQIYSNTAPYVRAHLQNFPLPDGKVADVLASTHACTTANALVNYSRCVQQRH